LTSTPVPGSGVKDGDRGWACAKAFSNRPASGTPRSPSFIGCGDISAPPLLNARFHDLDYSYGHWGTTTRTSTEPYGKDITQPRSPVPPTLWPAVASHRRVTTSRSLQPCAPQMQREVPHMAQSWSSRLSRALECLHTTSRLPQSWAWAKLHVSLCLLSQLHAGRGRHLDARLQLG
jgi:hypothetical protein